MLFKLLKPSFVATKAYRTPVEIKPVIFNNTSMKIFKYAMRLEI
jgi:hypothetical protein